MASGKRTMNRLSRLRPLRDVAAAGALRQATRVDG
jgi:hypothetical protein